MAAAPATTPHATVRRPRPIVYPTSDGKPMAETELHGDHMIYLREALETFFARPGQPLAHVGSNNFLFWQQGDPHKRISPDVYVVPGVAQRSRDSYKVWEENGHLPAVVFEITSRKARGEDVQTKRALYERTLGVAEYFQYDPKGEYLRPRLQGLRLDAHGAYQSIPLTGNGDRLHSEQLRLDLVLDGHILRLYDPIRQEFLLTAQEQAARAEAQAQRAQAEAERADAAEAELARLRARLAALENNDNPQR